MTTPATVQQGAPRDVPRDHWAFPAVDTLFRDGLLKGYPDSTFKGTRPATRYEMAGMLSQVNGTLGQRLQTLAAQVKELQERSRTTLSPAEKADMEKRMAQIRTDIVDIRRQQDEVRELTSRMGSLRDQLGKIRQQLGDLREQKQKIGG